MGRKKVKNRSIYLFDEVYERTDITRRVVHKVLSEYLKVITEKLADGEPVSLGDIGMITPADHETGVRYAVLRNSPGFIEAINHRGEDNA